MNFRKGPLAMKRPRLIVGSLLAVTAISIAYATLGNSRITPSPLPFIPPEGPVLLATNQNERTVTMTEVRRRGNRAEWNLVCARFEAGLRVAKRQRYIFPELY